MLGCFHLQGRVSACSMSVNSWAECETVLSYVRFFVAIASARESDLCVPVA